MKATELRIGNWVDQPNEGVAKVTSILNNLQIRTETGYVDKYCKSIPLTEEWLLKFGFFRHHYDYANDVIYIKNVVDNTEFEWGVYPFELGSGFIMNKSKNLKYVHQLQNLYFVLTGQELELKESQDVKR
jgi:hypothetical protein